MTWTMMALAIGLAGVAPAGNLPATNMAVDEEGDDILVTGRYDSPVDGYQAKRATGPTRIDTDLRNVPQAVTVLTGQAIADLGVRDIEGLLQYGGVGRANNFGGMLTYSVRGFETAEYFRNGMSMGTGFQPMPDAAAVDRIEVLRGPSAMVFGRGDPGGLINIVSKTPQDDAAISGRVQAGSFGLVRASLDVTGPLGGDVSFRLNASAEQGGAFAKDFDINRIYVAPILRWNPGTGTEIIVEGEYLRMRAPLYRGLPVYPGQTVRPARNFFLGEKAAGPLTNSNGLVEGRLRQAIGGSWTITAGVHYQEGDVRGGSVEAQALGRDLRSITRTYAERVNKWHNSVVQVGLAGEVETGPLRHRLMIGIDRMRDYWDTNQYRSNPRTAPMLLDLLTPVHGQPLPAITNTSHSRNWTRTKSVFVQDQIEIGRLNVLAGLRYDDYKGRTLVVLNGRNTKFDGDALTPRLGITYRLNDALSAYASYARSFRPNSGGDRNGDSFAPQKGRSYEGGVKADLFASRLSATVAVFDIVKDNVLTNDPADPTSTFRIATGRIRSRGADLNVAGHLTPELSIIGSYAFVDAEVARDSVFARGAPLSNIPKHQASLLASYAIPAGPLRGLGLGGGAVHNGRRWSGSTATRFSMDPYTTFEAMAHYDVTPDVRLSVNVRNLTNLRYDDRSWNSYAAPGAPRSVQFSISGKL